MEYGFEVKEIKKARKEGYVIASTTYEKNSKVYEYVRKTYPAESFARYFIIEGVRVYYHIGTYLVLKYEREYDTAGHKRISTAGKITDSIKAEVEEKAIEVKIPEVEVIDEIPEGPIHHKEFETIKMCIENNLPVYLAGPAGSGKNHTLEQIAEEIGMDFYFTNSVQQEFKLTGFVDAGGVFHETEFYKAFKNGGLFFLDEMDASIPEVLVLLNAAIANGYFEFPNGRIDAHEDFRVVSAGNTVGSGANEMYTGRMVLDQATLDRFVIIEFDYDRRVELSLAKGNVALVDFIRDLRDQSERNCIRATFSYRCITMVTKLEKSGMDLEKILQIAVVKGMDKDTINTFTTNNNRYSMALSQIA